MAAGVVAASGAVITVAHGLFWLDAAVAPRIAVIVAVGAVRLLLDVANAFGQGHAAEIDLD